MSEEGFEEFNLGQMDQWIQDTVGEDLSTELITAANASANVMYDKAMRIVGSLVDYKELMMMYTCAIKEIRTKFEVLNTEYNVRYRRNPIISISSRLKRTTSILEKLLRKNNSFNLRNIENDIHDIAGVRVICSYIDDIYKLADALLQQDDITLVKRKDYIKNPKPNGYRSLHLIVKVPVFFAEQKKDMSVEIQIRTLAMDFWANLEHQMKYKQEIPDQQEIIDRLEKCADAISAIDQEMLSIRNQIERASDVPSEEDILFEKLSKLDINIS